MAEINLVAAFDQPFGRAKAESVSAVLKLIAREFPTYESRFFPDNPRKALEIIQAWTMRVSPWRAETILDAGYRMLAGLSRNDRAIPSAPMLAGYCRQVVEDRPQDMIAIPAEHPASPEVAAEAIRKMKRLMEK